jgi:hypothetical protein
MSSPVNMLHPEEAWQASTMDLGPQRMRSRGSCWVRGMLFVFIRLVGVYILCSCTQIIISWFRTIIVHDMLSQARATPHGSFGEFQLERRISQAIQATTGTSIIDVHTVNRISSCSGRDGISLSAWFTS